MLLNNMNIVLVLILTPLAYTEDFDYCSITCDGEMHTMCQYAEGGGDECQDYEGGLTKKERHLILKLHNKLRQKVARGLVLPQPPAADMMMLQWNYELQKIAQRWIDQCTVFEHDTCRITKDEDEVGQNLAMGSYPNCSRAEIINNLMLNLYDEVLDVEPSLVECYQTNDNVTVGHYTQMMWAKTTHVGCGVSQNSDTVRMACNYWPAGNCIDSPIYCQGEACSGCPEGCESSSKYPGLCANTSS